MGCAKVQMQVEPSALEIVVKMKVSDLGKLLGIEADGTLDMRVEAKREAGTVTFRFVEIEGGGQ